MIFPSVMVGLAFGFVGCLGVRVKSDARSPYPLRLSSSRSSLVKSRSRGLASMRLRSLSAKLLRLWLRSSMVLGSAIGRRPAITCGADLMPWLTLKPNIIAMLSVQMSIALRFLGSSSANCAFSIHSGVAKIVPSATVEVISSPARMPTLPAVLSVAFTNLSDTLPNTGDRVPVTEPSKMPCPVAFNMSPAENSYSPVSGFNVPPSLICCCMFFKPSNVPKLAEPAATPATIRPASVRPT